MKYFRKQLSNQTTIYRVPNTGGFVHMLLSTHPKTVWMPYTVVLNDSHMKWWMKNEEAEEITQGEVFLMCL